MNPTELSHRKLTAAIAIPILALATTALVHADLDDDIRRVRMGTIVVETVPGAEIHVEQVSHEFWFGCSIASEAFNGKLSPSDRERYLANFLTLFNSGVTENALKWPSVEPHQGDVNYATVDAILAWAGQHSIPLRGHNVFWGVRQFIQPWVLSLDDAALRSTLEARAKGVARRYRGKFSEYDLNNEMLHENYYEQRLGSGITRDMAAWMRQEDPQAVLFVNDYDITTGRRVEDYAAQIRRLLDQGVPIGGIGVQGHLHGDTFDPVALRQSLDRLAAFRLPIRVTEFNFPGQSSKYYEVPNAVLSPEEEQAKARALVDFYRVCFAHPAVEGIVMWGFWEGANWIPVSSLFRRDWSPTPAASAYRDLIFRQWWTDWKGKADPHGRAELRAFHGRYRVTVGGQVQNVELPSRSPNLHLAFPP